MMPLPIGDSASVVIIQSDASAGAGSDPPSTSQTDMDRSLTAVIARNDRASAQEAGWEIATVSLELGVSCYS